MATELVSHQDAAVPVEVGFHTSQGFELMQRMAKLLAASQLVPKEFQGNIPNVTIALEMARRMNASPLAVMQNLYIVHGKPSWSSTFIIAAINSCGRFRPLRFDLAGKENSDPRTCIAWTVEHDVEIPRNVRTLDQARELNLPILESPPVSIAMAKAEGWYSRNGSKWQTMPELMLRYRCATLFGRLYAPEVLMGMGTVEEAIDITPETPPAAPSPSNGSRSEALTERLKQQSELSAGSSEATPAIEPPVAIDEADPLAPLRGEIGNLMAALDARSPGSADKAFEQVCGDAMTLDELDEPKLRELTAFLQAALKRGASQKTAEPAAAAPVTAEDLF